MTHEADPAKGGGPLAEMKIELDDAQLRDAVFSYERRITVWYRDADLQLVSLKQLAEFTLLHTPRYKSLDSLDLFFPSELGRKPLGFKTPVVIYASPHNPGAGAFASELQQAIEGINITEVPADLDDTADRSNSSKGKATHFLLYLNCNTFTDKAGTMLASELRKARAGQLPVVMAHEKDPERGGCDFARFFWATPADLLDSGLFQALAFAVYPGPRHRAVSLARIGTALGAVPVESGSISETSRRAIRRVSQISGHVSIRILSRSPSKHARKWYPPCLTDLCKWTGIMAMTGGGSSMNSTQVQHCNSPQKKVIRTRHKEQPRSLTRSLSSHSDASRTHDAGCTFVIVAMPKGVPKQVPSWHDA